MNRFILGVLLSVYFGCSRQSDHGVSNDVNAQSFELNNVTKRNIKTLNALRLEGDLSKNYKTVKSLIKEVRLNLNDEVSSDDSLSIVFERSLLNRIIPFWEGTKWSFEGHTSVPKQGEIACGYFVSTTLKDVGINLNRYKLAQQSPINEATSLALGSKVMEIAENSVEENVLRINESLKEGIHFIGFDSGHVGYILKEDEQLYLIHSNYLNSKGVGIEKIEESVVFTYYYKFYLVEISTNKKLLESWVKGTEVQVFTGE